jgi:hypothetical protein
VPQFAAGGDAPGPVDDERRGNAPIVRPDPVPPERYVAGTRPARPEAQIGFLRPGSRGRIVPAAADHERGRRCRWPTCPFPRRCSEANSALPFTGASCLRCSRVTCPP